MLPDTENGPCQLLIGNLKQRALGRPRTERGILRSGGSWWPCWTAREFLGLPGLDGLLVDGMQAKAAAHLVGAIRGLGYEIGFEGPGAGVTEAIRHIVWAKWSKDEIGEHQFIGRLFGELGRIYGGCTAFDASRYTLRRLAAVGGKLCSGHQS